MKVRFRALLGPVVLCAQLIDPSSGKAAIDATGKWRVDLGGPPQFVDVVQSGSSLTVPFLATTLTGSIDVNTGYFDVADTPVMTQIHGRVLPGSLRLVGNVAVLPALLGSIRATRCECFDGNAADGDGCDSGCQLEPCFTCSGMPSVCTPTGNGMACDDRNPCTSGEMCTAGACGGGSPVAPCVNLTGQWFQRSASLFGSVDTHVSIVQLGTVLEFGAASYGSIDPTTGGFETTNPGPLSPICFFTLAGSTGTAALDGKSYTSTSTFLAPTPTHCTGFTSADTGSRCGGGTLDPGEQCDDGNQTPGDGCDATCHVDSCVGQPDGTACDDRNPCTTGDACTDSACGGIVLDDGTPCSDGDACTTAAVCTGGSCGGATTVECGACRTCDTAQGCVAAPRPACTDAAAGLSRFEVKNSAGYAAVSWTWGIASGGSALDFGNPFASDDYTLCVYDHSTATPALLFRALAPAGGTCAGAACWQASSAVTVRYRDPDMTPDGLGKILLKKLRSGGARATVKGRGPLLGGRPFGLPVPPLSLPLEAQLPGENGACLAATYDAGDVLRNSPGRFRARAQ